MKTEIQKIKDLKINPKNPRVIKDIKYKRLLKSIKEFPEMLDLRPIMVDENNVVLGGNMRLKACRELKKKEVPTIRFTEGIHKASYLYKEKKIPYEEACEQLIIKDNASFGEWDWDVLANEWDTTFLSEWGVDVWQNMDDVVEKINEMDEWVGMPEFEEKNPPLKVTIKFENEIDRQKFCEDKGIDIGIKLRDTWTTWWPFKEQQDLKSLKYETEISSKFPIYIPSKGRAKFCKTANEFLKETDDFKIVVEPQDYDSYLEVYNEKNLMVLDKDNQGIGYSREFIKMDAENNGDEYYWTFDDDLHFLKREVVEIKDDGTEKEKNIRKNPMSVVDEVENYVQLYKNIGQVGLTHQAYAFAKKKDLDYNRQCCTAVLHKTKVNAIHRLKLKEDTDFSLQILREDLCTINFNKLLYDNPAFGKNEGGLSDEYRNNVTERQKEFISLNPEFEIKKVEGKAYATAIKPSRIWQTFKNTPQKK